MSTALRVFGAVIRCIVLWRRQFVANESYWSLGFLVDVHICCDGADLIKMTWLGLFVGLSLGVLLRSFVCSLILVSSFYAQTVRG